MQKLFSKKTQKEAITLLYTLYLEVEQDRKKNSGYISEYTRAQMAVCKNWLEKWGIFPKGANMGK